MIEKMKYFVVGSLCILALAGCAQKLPSFTADNVGVLAIPMKVVNDSQSELVYYYSLSGGNPDVEVTIYPAVGNDFVFSKALPAGAYQFDTFAIIGAPSSNMMTSINKKEYPISPAHTFTIKAGTISMLDNLLEVSSVAVDSEKFMTSQRVVVLNDADQKEYISKLEEMATSGEWEIELLQ